MTQVIIDEEDTYGFEYKVGGKLLLKTYADGSQRKYYYDGIQVILEKTKPAQGSWTTSKVYTLGGGDIGFIIGEREISGQNNTDRWYHYDRLGNVMALSNSSGQASTTYDQDAFGNVLSGSQNGYHLTTKDNHTDIGLYYFYQRWYDSVLGRFTKKHPFRPDIEHPYVYCENNPLRRYDPDGNKTKDPNEKEKEQIELCIKICEKLVEQLNLPPGVEDLAKKACKPLCEKCPKIREPGAKYCNELFYECLGNDYSGDNVAECDAFRQKCIKIWGD